MRGVMARARLCLSDSPALAPALALAVQVEVAVGGSL